MRIYIEIAEGAADCVEFNTYYVDLEIEANSYSLLQFKTEVEFHDPY
ncbi:MAG: hypothetical protein INQ03_25625 [Candidatus Heimdallarchaeota archaeon]|nr:hypothetical protein [Candidatus Heimdallarchaeota archaeon]